MFGIRYIKVQPTTYLLQYRRGKVMREGVGLAFFYYAPSTSLVAIPIGSTDVPFIFEEPTGDYQTVTLQGQVSYRVVDAKKLAGLMNFTLSANRARLCLGRSREIAAARHQSGPRAGASGIGKAATSR